jgi:enterochelin esterase-like enzyme
VAWPSRRWLGRGAAAAAVAAAVVLVVLMEPLPEPGDTEHTPTETVTPAMTYTPTASATPPATATPTAIPPGRLESGSYWSDTTGREETYLIYLPPGYGQGEGRYPVLYLLHGYPYDEHHWDQLGVVTAADEGIQAGSLPLFIIVLPRGGGEPDGLYVGSSGGDGSFEAQVVSDLVPYIDSSYRTCAEREGRAIGGISRGGVWSLEIGFRRGDLFSVVGGHSVALQVNSAPAAYDPFFLVDEPSLFTQRIYLDAGDADWALAGTRDLHEALDERHIDHVYSVHEGRHVDDLWAEHVPEYLEFYTANWPAAGYLP